MQSQLINIPETFADVDIAGGLPWRQGCRLLVSKEYNRAMYSLGYVIEMWLKLVAFRLLRAGNLDPVHIQHRRVDAGM